MHDPPTNTIPDLVHLVLKDANYGVRANAALALGAFVHGTPTNVVATLDRATYDKDVRVRTCAIRALAKLGTCATPALPRLLILTRLSLFAD